MFPSIERFEYERPKSIDEAIAVIRRIKSVSGRFVLSAGCTDILPRLKDHDIGVGALISLTGIDEIKGIRLGGGKKLSIGAGTTLAEIESDKTIAKKIPVLAQAAREIASPQIRFRATIGGNLLVDNRCIHYNQTKTVRKAKGPCHKDGGDICHFIKKRAPGSPLCYARFVSDLAPVLMLLDAKLIFKGLGGSKSMSLKEFYLDDGISRNRMKPGQFLSHIEVPLPAPEISRYEKLRVRAAMDFPSLGVAVSRQKKRGKDLIGVALTGVATHPLFFEYSAVNFSGMEELLDHATSDAEKAAVILKQDFFPPSYRRKMIGVFIRRAAREL